MPKGTATYAILHIDENSKSATRRAHNCPIKKKEKGKKKDKIFLFNLKFPWVNIFSVKLKLDMKFPVRRLGHPPPYITFST